MKPTTKKVTSLLFAATIAASTLTAAGCGSKKRTEQAIKDPSICNIQVFKGGYGVEWLYELEAKFEAAYKDENYQINILTPSYDMKGSVAQQLLAQGYEETGVDLYIVGDLYPTMVGADSDYGVLASDIRETVFNKKAIGYDGQEEELTVGKKMLPDLVPFTMDTDGTMYGFNWVNAASGIAVNVKKLANYGITELPKTTNEMFDVFEKIYLGSNGLADSETTKTFPMVYNGYYGTTLMYTWLAQYSFDEYQRIATLENKNSDGTKTPMTENAWEIYKSDAMLEVVSAMYRMFDFNIASYGSTQLTLDQAQAAVLKTSGSNGVFMANGDWYLNEVKMNYKNYLSDIDFMRTPVISALGTRLFGANTSYNMSEADCDKLLSYIVALADDGKTATEVVSLVQSEKGVTITEAIAKEVLQARGIYYSRGVEHMAYIDKNAGAKNVAELFLRMMASDDFAETFAQSANATTPYRKLVNEYSQYNYVKNASKIFVNNNQKVIQWQLNDMKGYRSTIGLGMFTTTSNLPVMIAGSANLPTMYSEGKRTENTAQCYKDSATAFLQSEYDNLKKNWSYWAEKA